MSIIYMNGQFLSAEQALIPVADRGFRFGDGVFETIRVYAGVAYQLEWHLERLQRGLTAIKIVCGVQRAACNQLIEKNNLQNGFLRIAISRGVGSHGYLPQADIKPTIVMETLPLSDVPESASLYLSQFRKTSPSSLPTNYKLAQGMNSTLARMEAQEHGCFEALQLTPDDFVSEASSSNFFWVKDDVIYTPALEAGCLEGSTRAALMRLTKIEEIMALPSGLESADEVFITNCAWGVLPVTSLKPQGWNWKIGKIAKQLQTALKHDIEQYAYQHRNMA